MIEKKFIDPIDHEKAMKKAVEIADKKCELSFPLNERSSDKANRFWLYVFWKKFHAIVRA